jgi:hypothetical protein
MLTRAEALLASATATLAVAILAAYAPYRFGWRVYPFAILVIALAAGAAITGGLIRTSKPHWPETLTTLAIVAAVGAYFLWIARPALLPIGGGPDLAHHLVLINYIERTWKLVDDPALYPYLGDMMDYTPGAHLLIAMAGAWAHVPALRAVHPVLVLTVALKAGFVFAIARRLTPRDDTRVAAGIGAVLLLFVPYRYVAGSFTEHSYWPQVVSELFTCAAWWSIVVWDAGGWNGALALFALFGAASFVTWPIWIGPIAIMAAGAVILRQSLTLRGRLTALAMALAPVAAVAIVHTLGRSGRLQMAGTSGFAIRPSLSTLGWLFIVLACAGVWSLRVSRLRSTALLLGAIAAQAAVLYGLAQQQGASTPYLSLKMMYLAIYPLAVAAAVTIAFRPAVAWVAVMMIASFASYRIAKTPRPAPIVTRSTWQAGLWAREHLARDCVDYLVADGYTGYWLHLAVLDNPRGTPRFDDPATFDPQQAIARWVDVDGLPYAIVDDRRGFSKALFNGTDTLARFDQSLVIKRRGASTCPNR